jgi:hypothetical protein
MTAVISPTLILHAEFDQFRDNGLNKSCKAYSLIDPSADIGDSNLKGAKFWMRADVPPDFGRVWFPRIVFANYRACIS